MPTGVYERDPAKIRSYTIAEPIDETRQEYANARIAEFQRTHRDLQFEELLHAFRYYGMVYDQGFRLRDEQAGAA